MRHGLFAAVFTLIVFGLSVSAAQPKISLSSDKKDCICKKGETVVLTVNGKIPESGIKILMYQPNAAVKTLELPAGKNSVSLVHPGGAVRFEAVPAVTEKTASGRKKKTVLAAVGVIADPYLVRPGFTEPADFQQFWDRAKAELAKVPVKAERKEIEVTDDLIPKASSYFSYRVPVKMNEPKVLKGKFRCWDVKVDCVGGVPVSGYLTMPADAKPKSLPAIVTFQGAGVKTANKAFVSGAIRFDVNAHGIENGQPADYYRKLAAGKLKGYTAIGLDSRDKYYFRNMYLRVQRALDYIKTLPEYDGKTLIVAGNSQGGGQTLVAAGLDPDVKLILASVPAMCDHGGILAGRISGWPRLVKMKNGKAVNPEAVRTLPYFDAAFFAKRIKAEAYLTVGLIDVTCSPTSVFAAYNNIPGKKHITVLPYRGHRGTLSPAFVKRVQQTVQKKTLDVR